jgi:hypothetical protein
LGYPNETLALLLWENKWNVGNVHALCVDLDVVRVLARQRIGIFAIRFTAYLAPEQGLHPAGNNRD